MALMVYVTLYIRLNISTNGDKAYPHLLLFLVQLGYPPLL